MNLKRWWPLMAADGDPAPGGGGGVDPSGKPPSSPSPGAPPAAPPWFAMDGMAPDQVAQFGEMVKTKGWKHPGEAVMSYANLEKVWGADKAGRTVMLPASADDAEGLNAIYDKLGRPAKPEDYKLPVPEGDDGSFIRAFSPHLHAAGLSQKQAETLATAWNTYIGEALKTDSDAFQAESKRNYETLQGEWGAAAKGNEELARRAVAKFGGLAGLDADGLSTLERAMGTSAMLKMFHAIGASFSEGSFVGGEAPAGGALTPALASAAIMGKFADKDFMGRYMNQDARIRQGAIDEMLALQRQAHPELAQAG